MISRKFREYMSEGNTNSATKLLSNNMEGCVLSLIKEKLALLKKKQPVGKAASEDTKLHSPLPTVEKIFWRHRQFSGSGGDENYSKRL